MSQNWHDFFFGAFDPWGTVSVDKLPGAFWLQALSVRLFGFHIWAMVLPQAIEGTLTVLVLYRAVRRVGGAGAGLVAAAALATTPVTILLNRGNISDSLLILLLVLAADATTSAFMTGRLQPLVLAGVWVGLAFQAKMLQAWVVLPALFLAYILAAPVASLERRVGQVALSLLAVVAVSLELDVRRLPRSRRTDRPYVDGSCNNSVFSQVFLYNGADRLSGDLLDQPGCSQPPVGRATSTSGGAPTHALGARARPLPRRRARTRGGVALRPVPGRAGRHPRGPPAAAPHRPLARRRAAVGHLALPDLELLLLVALPQRVLPGGAGTADGRPVRAGVRPGLEAPGTDAGRARPGDGRRRRRGGLRRLPGARCRRGPPVGHRHQRARHGRGRGLPRLSPCAATGVRGSGAPASGWPWWRSSSAARGPRPPPWATSSAPSTRPTSRPRSPRPSKLSWQRAVAGWPADAARAARLPSTLSALTNESSAQASGQVLATGHEFLAVGGFSGQVPATPLRTFIDDVRRHRVVAVLVGTDR